MRCAECGTPVAEIGHHLWYCDDCDRIITDEKELIKDEKDRRLRPQR